MGKHTTSRPARKKHARGVRSLSGGDASNNAIDSARRAPRRRRRAHYLKLLAHGGHLAVEVLVARALLALGEPAVEPLGRVLARADGQRAHDAAPRAERRRQRRLRGLVACLDRLYMAHSFTGRPLSI